jgi:hypothetical protein
MIEYCNRIEDFWSKDLASYVFTENVSTGQQDLFHKNYSDPKNDLLQGFDDNLPEIRNDFFKSLGITEGTISWTLIKPGNTIPLHSDTFHKIRSKYNIDISQCLRYLIFLEDWTLGHFVEFEELYITKWKKGDVWKFDYNSPHCAANSSHKNFYTCQVNTIK